MIRTILLIALFSVLIVIARTHPETVPDAVRSVGATVNETFRPAVRKLEKALDTGDDRQASPGVSVRKQLPEPVSSEKQDATPPAAAKTEAHPPAPLPSKPVVAPEEPKTVAVDKAVNAPDAALVSPTSAHPVSAGPETESAIQRRLRAAARFLAETDLPR